MSRQVRLKSLLFALKIGLSSALLCSCSSSGKQYAEFATLAERASREFSVICEVQASCTKRKCADISSESCAKRLAAKAGQLGADAVIVDEEGFESTGHAGAVPIRHWCKGRALTWKLGTMPRTKSY